MAYPTNKDNDVDLLRKIAQNTADISGGGGGGGGSVDSVNGQTGAVVLDNEDVGAPSDAELAAVQAEVDAAEEGIAALEADVAQLVGGSGTTSPSGNFLKSGGNFAHDGGLDIAVGASEYYIQGVLHTSPADVITASAADATNPRIDAVVLNSSNVAAIVTGTPAASPVRPEIDPSTQLELTFITVAALATEPQITVEPIYLENTEWTITPSAGTIDPDDTTGERTGTKAIKITAGASGANFKAVDAAPLDIAGYSQLTMWINPVTWVSQKQLQVRCYLSNSPVGNIVTIRDGVFGFIRTVASYQLVAIPTSLFGLAGIEPDEVRWTIAGGGTNLTCFIDDIALQGGMSSTVSNAMVNPMTTAGDSIVGGTDGAPERRAAGSYDHGLKHFAISFNPKAVCDGTIDRLFLMTVGPDYPNGLRITRWNCSFDADPDNEADLDFKRADAFIGVANAAVIDVLDTTNGAASETTAANINGDAIVANGKVLYLEFGTAYTADNLQIIFEFWGYAV